MEIRAREFGDVLNEGVRLFVKVWKRLIPPAFGAFVVVGAITVVAFVATDATTLIDIALNDPDQLDLIPDEELSELFTDLLVAVGVSALFQGIASVFVSLVAHRLAGSEIAGVEMSSGQASAFAARKTLPLLGAYLMAGLGVFIGFLLLIVPGVWLAGSWTMTAPAMALEGKGAVDSLRRSFELVRGRWWHTVGFMLLVGLLGSVAAQLVQFLAVPLLLVGGSGFGAGLAYAIAVVGQGIIVAAIAVVATAWYVDLRARKEPLLSEMLG